MNIICPTEYCPIMAQAAIDVPEYSFSRFMVVENKESIANIRPIGVNVNFKNSSMYMLSQLDHHKFWVLLNKQNFRSVISESDLANPDNIIGVGCFLYEKQDSKYFVFNINNMLFFGPAIFPSGGSYVKLNNHDVLHDGTMPHNDHDILKSYLDDIKNVEYWDFKKHA